MHGGLAMNPKKRISLRFLFVLLLAIIILSSCGGNYMSPERALRDFSSRIEQGNLGNLTLTIYYRDLRSTVRFPYSVEDLVDWGHVHKIVVDDNALKEHIELLRAINADNLIPIAHELPMDAMLYYVFEVGGRKIFGFVPQAGGNDSSMFINGVEFEWNDIFFDVVRPFLPKDEVKLWDASLMP